MIQSMTAFARGTLNLGDYQLTVTLKAVNHRFLDLSLRMPEQLQDFEPEIRNRLRKRLERGRVECTITLFSPQPTELVLNTSVLERMQIKYRDLQKFFPNLQLDFTRILSWPGLMVPREFEVTLDPLLQITDKVVEQLEAMRYLEGASLSKALVSRLTNIEQIVQSLYFQSERSVEDYRKRLKEKVLALISSEFNPQLFEQEVVYFAEKVDVSEELDRLQAHVIATREILDNEVLAGKKLDFLMQEFNREANTLSAKAANLEITKQAIELKLLIEQMREQVQNIL